MDAAYFQSVHARVLAQTGDRRVADQAAANAKYVLDQIFHGTMVANGGNEPAAHAAVARHAQQVARLAELVPGIRAGGAGSSAALNEAVRILQGAGLNDRSALHSWLRQNVSDDQTLAGAGFDPEEVRKFPLPEGLPTDRSALLDLVRQYLVGRGDLSMQEVEGYLDVARGAMERLNIGEPSPEPIESDAESVPVANLGIPIRV